MLHTITNTPKTLTYIGVDTRIRLLTADSALIRTISVILDISKPYIRNTKMFNENINNYISLNKYFLLLNIILIYPIHLFFYYVFKFRKKVILKYSQVYKNVLI